MKRRMDRAVAPLMALAIAGCSASNSPNAGNDHAAVDAASSNSVAATASAPGVANVPRKGRTVAVNVQGVAPVGVTVRVLTVELGTDATVLDVSASYGGTITNDIALAGAATYLLDEQGNRLMLKPPQDNQYLRVVKGQTMQGKLVFLGAVAENAKSVKLVFNDNNDGNNLVDPGLTIPLPLESAAQ